MRHVRVVCALAATLFVSITQLKSDELKAFRAWTDSSGKRTAQAAFVERKEDRVILRRPDGRLARVELTSLSDADQQYVNQLASRSLVSNANTDSLNGLVSGLSRTVRGASTWFSSDWKKSLAKVAVPETKTSAIETGIKPARLATIKVSRNLLAQRIERDIAKQEYLHDVIVSVPIQGPAFTQGRTTVQFVASPHQGVVDILLHGVCDSDTSGSTQGVTIHSHGTTNFAARKRLLITSSGVQPLPAVSSATTQTQTTGIDTSRPRLRGRIATRIASSRVADTRGQANWESARHAEQRINAALDKEIETLLAAIQPRLSRTTAELASIQRDTGYQLRYSTTPLHLVISVDDPQGDAEAMPPVINDDRLVAVQLHNSLFKQVMGNDRLRQLLYEWSQSRQADGMLVSARAADMQMRSRWSRDGNWLTIHWADQSANEPVEKLAGQ
jgi:SLA1 Homology Domain 1 (SHD1) protein